MEIFKYKKPNFDKLVKFGFTKREKIYQIDKEILDGEFVLSVFVTESGEVSTKIVDKSSGDEYFLHLLKDSVGEFVGRVREEFEATLNEISESCFESDVFKSKQAKVILEFADRKGNKLEFLWDNSPNVAILRRSDTKKWYAVLFVLPKSKLDNRSGELVDIIDLRLQPDELEKIVDGKKYFRAYHMNKKHWFSMALDDSVSTQDILKFVENSFNLAK